MTLKDGTVIDRFLPESLGNVKRPLSNDQLNDKFLNQITALGGDQAQQVLDACWKLEEMENVGDLVRATVPR